MPRPGGVAVTSIDSTFRALSRCQWQPKTPRSWKLIIAYFSRRLSDRCVIGAPRRRLWPVGVPSVLCRGSQQVLVSAHAVAVAADVGDVAVMQYPIAQRAGRPHDALSDLPPGHAERLEYRSEPPVGRRILASSTLCGSVNDCIRLCRLAGTQQIIRSRSKALT